MVEGPRSAREDRRDFQTAGVPVEDFVVAGGLLKNLFVLQIYADVLRRPLHLIGSYQGPALGSAIHAAAAAGILPDVHAARRPWASRARRVRAHPAAADAYDELYADYTRLHDHFGRGGDDVASDAPPAAAVCGEGQRLRGGPVQNRTPSIGVLGIMQELYDDMLPGITERQGRYLAEVAAALDGRRGLRGRAARAQPRRHRARACATFESPGPRRRA